MNGFDVLASLDEDDNDHGPPVNPPPPTRSSPPESEADEKAKGALNEEQKKIVAERRQKRDQKRLAKEVARRCFYFDECKSIKEKDWPYCRECYQRVHGSCATPSCPNLTTLTAEPGVLHAICQSCRTNQPPT
jgi:hypothetical protein